MRTLTLLEQARWRNLIRVYRLWENRNQTIIAIVISSEVAWFLYLQFTWVTMPELEMLAVVTVCLAIENYYVNVKLREQQKGGRELNPIWRKIEQCLNFTYAFPIVFCSLIAAGLVCGAVFVPHVNPFWIVSAWLAIILPVGIFASVNDLCVFLDGPIDLERASDVA